MQYHISTFFRDPATLPGLCIPASSADSGGVVRLKSAFRPCFCRYPRRMYPSTRVPDWSSVRGVDVLFLLSFGGFICPETVPWWIFSSFGGAGWFCDPTCATTGSRSRVFLRFRWIMWTVGFFVGIAGNGFTLNGVILEVVWGISSTCCGFLIRKGILFFNLICV